jgi:hypothetical protein
MEKSIKAIQFARNAMDVSDISGQQTLLPTGKTGNSPDVTPQTQNGSTKSGHETYYYSNDQILSLNKLNKMCIDSIQRDNSNSRCTTMHYPKIVGKMSRT